MTVITRAQADPAAFGLCTGKVVVRGSSSQGDSRCAFGVRQVAVPQAVDKDRARGAMALSQC